MAASGIAAKKNGPRLNKSKVKKAAALNASAYSLMLPAIILFCLFSIYPVLYAFRYCFYNYDGVTKPIYVGLKNFAKIFSDNDAATYYWNAWPRTILYGVIKLSIEYPLALICAFLINKKIRAYGFFRSLFYMPQILPGMITGVLFVNMLNPYNGFVSTILQKAGLLEGGYSILQHANSAFVAGIIIDVWCSFGINMLFFLAGLSGINKELYESAYMDGASEKQAFRYITIPGIARLGQIMLLLSMVASFRSMGSYFVLTQGGPDHSTELVFLRIYRIFFAESSRVGFGCAVAVVSAAILAVIAFLYNHFTKKLRED